MGYILSRLRRNGRLTVYLYSIRPTSLSAEVCSLVPAGTLEMFWSFLLSIFTLLRSGLTVIQYLLYHVIQYLLCNVVMGGGHMKGIYKLPRRKKKLRLHSRNCYWLLPGVLH